MLRAQCQLFTHSSSFLSLQVAASSKNTVKARAERALLGFYVLGGLSPDKLL